MMSNNVQRRDDKAYYAFLVRLWRAGDGWCASLQDPAGRVGFSSVEELFVYLLRLTDAPVRGEVAAAAEGDDMVMG